MFICPKCKRSYNQYYEVLKYQDEIESSHDEEGANIELTGLDAGSSGLLSADSASEEYQTLDEQYEQLHNKGKIPIPKYMKGNNVENFQEEIN